MIILNLHVEPVRTKVTNTQKMNISEMNTKNTPNSDVCSSDDRKSKRINADETLSHVCSTDKKESKSVIINAFSTDKRK